MSEATKPVRISERPNEVAIQLCQMLSNDDATVKEAFRLAIQKAMSDAVVSAKQDLIQTAFNAGTATTPLVELIDEGIPTFGGTGNEYSSRVFGAQ